MSASSQIQLATMILQDLIVQEELTHKTYQPGLQLFFVRFKECYHAVHMRSKTSYRGTPLTSSQQAFEDLAFPMFSRRTHSSGE